MTNGVVQFRYSLTGFLCAGSTCYIMRSVETCNSNIGFVYFSLWLVNLVALWQGLECGSPTMQSGGLIPGPSGKSRYDLILTNYISNNPTSKSSHTLRSWGLGHWCVFLGDTILPITGSLKENQKRRTTWLTITWSMPLNACPKVSSGTWTHKWGNNALRVGGKAVRYPLLLLLGGGTRDLLSFQE